jgi:hypothetical protein
MFRSESNVLYFFGNTGDDVLPVVAALHNLINKSGFLDIELNFAQSENLDVRFMLPLVATARSYRRSKVDFLITPPNDNTASRFLINTNWAHLISPEKFPSMEDRNIEHLSAIQYINEEEQYNAVNRCMEVLLKTSKGLDRSHAKALEWSLNEITDNVLNHADSPIGGLVQAVTNSRRSRVDFYVCDAGIGIPRSLRQGHPEIRDDPTALRQAIEEGVTRNSSTNQGNGLFGTFKCCEVSNSNFDILSGRVSLHYTPESLNTLRVTTNQIPFRGTFIPAINYGVEGLLERALVFKGKRHDPGNDYIERRYLSTGDAIEFKVRDELSSFGTRSSGRLARTKIENLMDNKRRAVEFDFQGILLISSSFADEVFGMLFASLGPITFGNLCKFKNVDSTVQSLIDRAIYQRMRQS